MSIRNELLENIHSATVANGAESYYVEATRFAEYTTQLGSVIDTFSNVILGGVLSDPDGLVTNNGAGGCYSK